MKSFSQFLQEEEARQGSLMTRSGKPQDFRNPKKIPFTATDPTPLPASKRLPAAGSSEAPKTSPGQLEIPNPKTTKVPGSTVRSAGEARQGSLLTKSGQAQNFTGGRTPFVGTEPVKATKRLPSAPPEAPKTSPGQQVIRQTSNPPTTKALPPGSKGGPLAKTTSSTLAKTPEIKPVSVRDVTPKPKALSAGKPPSVSPTSPTRQAIQNTRTGTDVAKAATDTLGKGGKFAKWGGRALAGAGAALDAADEYKAQRARGRTRGSSAAMGVTKAAGGLAGAEAGAAGGAALGATIGSIVPGAGTAIGGAVGGIAGGIGGYLGGSHLAGKASEVVAGATGKEKAAMATANRQRQAGSALKGIGGPTTFNTKKNTMTTGVGSQRKTVQLAKTSVVTGPGGKQEIGYLSKKGGQLGYKEGPDPSTLAKTSTNWAERVGRTFAAGAYAKHDADVAAKKLAQARQSDTLRNRALGVKMLPGK